MSLPAGLQPWVDEVLGSVRTAGTVIFTASDGHERSASIWFVVCPTRCWLVAGSGDAHVAIASAEVELTTGWTWDAVQVGSWTAPLRTGTRSRAKALLVLWGAQPGGGEAVEREEVKPASTPIAEGAQLPRWIAAEVPEDAEARWLFAYETAETYAFPGRDGTPARRPLWLAVSDRGCWLAARGGFAQPVRQIAGEGRRGLRSQIDVDGRILAGSLVDRKREVLLALTAVDGDARWAVATGLALEQGEPERALKLLTEAFLLARHGRSWLWLGALAWAADQQERALQSAYQHLEYGSFEAGVAAWTLTEAVELPAGPFAEVQLPALPDGFPDALTPTGVYATAAVLRGQVEAGLDAWAVVDPARAATARASLEQTAAAWMEAALAWRGLHGGRAAQALDRALELDARPAWLYRAAAWAHEDGRAPQSYWRRAFPAAPPRDLEMPDAAWRQLAETAEHEALLPSIAAWRALAEPDLLWRAADALEQDHPAEALIVMDQLVDDPGEQPRWRALRRYAALQKTLDGAQEAEDALWELVREDFLVPDALDAALAEGTGLVDDDDRRRWRHLRAQLGPERAEPLPPLCLDRAALDSLHPGGVGWLERTRHRLDTAAPPERSQLVRGLERISSVDRPKLSARIERLSERLGLASPPVYLFRGEGAWGLSAWPTEPPLLLLGHDHLRPGHPQFLEGTALGFAIAVELAHLAAGHPLLAFDQGIVGTSRSVYATFGAYASTAEAVVDVLTLLPGVDQIAKIQTLVRLSRRVFTARSAIDKASGAAKKGLDWFKGDQAQTVGRSFEGVALQFRLHADRAAWAITGDLHGAIDAMLAADPQTAVLRELFAAEGVVPVLEQADGDLTVRIASLLSHAAQGSAG